MQNKLLELPTELSFKTPSALSTPWWRCSYDIPLSFAASIQLQKQYAATDCSEGLQQPPLHSSHASDERILFDVGWLQRVKAVVPVECLLDQTLASIVLLDWVQNITAKAKAPDWPSGNGVGSVWLVNETVKGGALLHYIILRLLQNMAAPDWPSGNGVWSVWFVNKSIIMGEHCVLPVLLFLYFSCIDYVWSAIIIWG